MSGAKSSGGSFAPLAQPVFAVLWAATVLGNTGSFMRDITSSWLMTDLSASPAAVAMVQAAGTLPIFLLAIPAGVLTDILSLAPSKWVAIVALMFLGCAWITALTTLNGTAQAVLPNWVRGRGLAVYLTVFNGVMTAGSIGWGAVGEITGIQGALLIGAAGLLVAGFIMHRLKLPAGDADMVPSNHWPEPLAAQPVAHDRGPVLILIEYHIEKSHRDDFLHAISDLSQERRRDGAYGWGVTEDSADPQKMVEWFMVESWAEHLRQHRRVSHADADLQSKVFAYHSGPEKPVVRHFLAINRPGAA